MGGCCAVWIPLVLPTFQWKNNTCRSTILIFFQWIIQIFFALSFGRSDSKNAHNIPTKVRFGPVRNRNNLGEKTLTIGGTPGPSVQNIKNTSARHVFLLCRWSIKINHNVTKQKLGIVFYTLALNNHHDFGGHWESWWSSKRQFQSYSSKESQWMYKTTWNPLSKILSKIIG